MNFFNIIIIIKKSYGKTSLRRRPTWEVAYGSSLHANEVKTIGEYTIKKNLGLKVTVKFTRIENWNYILIKKGKEKYLVYN